MFTEPNSNYSKVQNNGSIEIICGPMFSGKTEELLRRLRRIKIAKQNLAIFKPELDIRYSEMRIVSHDANYFPALAISKPLDILKHSIKADVVAIDEIQFFNEEIIEVVETLAIQGRRVIAAGLDLDYLGKPFGIMPQLLAVSNYLTKLNAICVRCGALATHSYRLLSENSQIFLGEKNTYEPRCRACFHTSFPEKENEIEE